MLSECSESELDALQAKAPVVAQQVVPKDTMLLVPWGWIVVERTLNAEIVSGYRWMLLSDTLSDSFKCFANRLLPQDLAGVKVQIGAHFVMKVVQQLVPAEKTAAANGAAQAAPSQQVKEAFDALTCKVEKRADNGQPGPKLQRTK